MRALSTEWLYTRLGVFNLLRHAFFQEPTARLAALCADARLMGDFPRQSTSTAIADGLAQIAAYFSTYSPHLDADDLQALRWDFTQLFIGPAAPTAPPWASYYLEPDGCLFQSTTLTARRALQRYQLIAGDRVNAQADDHVGIECDFLYQTTQLAMEQPAVRDQILADQATFISEAMLPFVPQFVALVCTHAHTDFYRGLARLFEGFLVADYEDMLAA